jgi:hypothetical protein
VTVTVRVPFTGSATITLATIPARNAPLPEPMPQEQTSVPVSQDGTLQVTLPQIADGDAWQIMITPS